MRNLVALLALLTAAACAASPEPTSSDEAEIKTPRDRWNVNDVSFLFPQPAEGEASKLLPMRAGDKVLLPENVFAILGTQSAGVPFLIEAPGRDQLYPKLRVTSIRVDPCFDAPALRTATSCVRQVRLTAQPLLEREGAAPEIFDASIHLFYPLDDASFVTLLRGLRDLKKANTGDEPLSVHPVMKREGLSGAYATRLKELVLNACDASRLSRMTFMATGRSGNNWFWGILDRRADGTWSSSPIPERGEQKSDGFSLVRGGAHEDDTLGSPLFPDELLRTNDVATLPEATFLAAAEKLQRIANPNALPTTEVSCSTCHVGGMMLGHTVAKRGLASAPNTPSTFPFPAGQNATSADEGTTTRNMHAFSWFQDTPTVSQRTLNESARIADFIPSDDFARSLSPALRAEWLRP